jgi:hypothetical protein
MTLQRSRDPRLVRQLCGGLAAVAVVQILLLQPALGTRLVASGTGMLAVCVLFGMGAFIAWLMTGVRWPLLAWATAVLIVAIDQNMQTQNGDRDAFGAFADGAAVPAPLLSAHGSTARDRFTRNGD